MVKIIDGKMYDTTTAECLYRWDNGKPLDDEDYCKEELYRTQKGAFFLTHKECTSPEEADDENSNLYFLELPKEGAIEYLEIQGAGDELLKYFPEEIIAA